MDTGSEYEYLLVDDPYITIRRSGHSISLNKSALQAVGNPKRVLLNYDKAKHTIIIAPVAAHSTLGNPVNKASKKNYYTISCKNFLHDNNMNTDTARRYRAFLQNNRLIIDLNGPFKDVTGPNLGNKRKKKQPSSLSKNEWMGKVMAVTREAVSQGGIPLGEILQELDDKLYIPFPKALDHLPHGVRENQ